MDGRDLHCRPMTTRIHLAKPGTFTDAKGRKVTLGSNTIAALASSYQKSSAPLVLGHPADGAPAYGWVDTVEVDAAGNLWGNVDKVAPDLASAVEGGQYKNVSISWWPEGHSNSPSPETPTLRHVGVLGAQRPAIPNLTPISFSDDAGIISIDLESYDEMWGWDSVKRVFRGIREWLIEREGVEEADKVIPAYVIDDADGAADAVKPENEPQFSSPEPKMPPPNPAPAAQPAPTLADQLAAEKAKSAELQAKVDASDAAAEATALEQRKGAAVSFADGLVKDGKLAPAAKDVIVDLHQRLAQDDEPVAFSDGKSEPALNAFEGLFKGAKPIINLSAVSDPDQSTVPDANSTTDLSDRASAIMVEKPSISHAEAVRMAEREASEA